MNEDLQAVNKFRTISAKFFIAFLCFTLIVIPTFSYLLKNYWLLFGIAFSFIGYILYKTKFEKIFIPITIATVLYWIDVGFHFSDQVTFFWLSFFFGNLFKSFVKSYNDLADKILDLKASEMSSYIKRGIKEAAIRNNTNKEQ